MQGQESALKVDGAEGGSQQIQADLGRIGPGFYRHSNALAAGVQEACDAGDFDQDPVLRYINPAAGLRRAGQARGYLAQADDNVRLGTAGLSDNQFGKRDFRPQGQS
jgi:hypothetical protein